jgi:hypothetical protein
VATHNKNETNLDKYPQIWQKHQDEQIEKQAYKGIVPKVPTNTITTIIINTGNSANKGGQHKGLTTSSVLISKFDSQSKQQ